MPSSTTCWCYHKVKKTNNANKVVIITRKKKLFLLVIFCSFRHVDHEEGCDQRWFGILSFSNTIWICIMRDSHFFGISMLSFIIIRVYVYIRQEPSYLGKIHSSHEICNFTYH
jgi:hypothetical protein